MNKLNQVTTSLVTFELFFRCTDTSNNLVNNPAKDYTSYLNGRMLNVNVASSRWSTNGVTGKVQSQDRLVNARYKRINAFNKAFKRLTY